MQTHRLIALLFAVSILVLPWANATMSESEIVTVMARGQEVLGHEWQAYVELANVLRLTRTQEFQAEFNQTVDMLINQTRTEIDTLNKTYNMQMDYYNFQINQSEAMLDNMTKDVVEKKKQVEELKNQSDPAELAPLQNELKNLNTQLTAFPDEPVACDDFGTAQQLYQALNQQLIMYEANLRLDAANIITWINTAFDSSGYQQNVPTYLVNSFASNMIAYEERSRFYAELATKCHKAGLDELLFVKTNFETIIAANQRWLRQFQTMTVWELHSFGSYETIFPQRYTWILDGTRFTSFLDYMNDFIIGRWARHNQRQVIQAQLSKVALDLASVRAKGTQTSSAIESLKTIIKATEETYIPEQTKNIQILKNQRSTLQTETPKQIAAKQENIQMIEKLKDVMASKYVHVAKTGYQYDVISNIAL